MLGIAFGTRPEWLKIKPVCVELDRRKIPFRIIFTGQHESLLDGVDFDKRIYIHDNEKNRLNKIVTSLISEESALKDLKYLMVQGDTTSAFAMALSAFHKGIPVIHLEAGLRTNDIKQPFPEESNRQMISCIASLHLCPTEDSRKNLIKENRNLQSSIVVTGNTVLDNIRDVVTSQDKKVLITMHRRENHANLKNWFEQIDLLASKYSEYDFILPIHPNPNVLKYKNIFNSVKVVDPMSHEDLIKYLASCERVITDSGGLQEEAAFLRKPCMVCRQDTERREGLGNFSLLCTNHNSVDIVFQKLLHLEMSGDCPYGNGYAAIEVVNAIERF